MRIRAAVTAVVVLLSSAAALAADTVREGKWQYTSTMQMEGMPQMPKMPEGAQMPPGMKMPSMGPGGMTSTYESCITKDNPVPQNKDRERNCKMTSMKRDGNHVSWTATCDLPDGGSAESVGDATYTGDSSQMTIKTKSMHKGHAMNMTMNITGKYLGPCN